MDILENDWEHIMKKLEKEARPLRYERINEGNIEKVSIHVFANKYVQMLVNHTNYVHTGGYIPVSDVLDVLCTEMVCSFLNMSPMDLFHDPAFKQFVFCDEAMYFRVYQIFAKNPDEQVPYKVSETVERIEQVISESCRWCYNRHAWISLDDDKAPVSGIGAA